MAHSSKKKSDKNSANAADGFAREKKKGFKAKKRRAYIEEEDLLELPKKKDPYPENNKRVFAQFGEQEQMLADKPRMNFYREMIRRHIHEGDRVIDLGTGTGILSAFASWQKASQIHALDHSDIIEHARALAAHNGIEGVQFHDIHSKDFKLDERVDVILHEQMGDILFDEDMVANVTDLRDRLLKEGGRILPARFELYCEPIQIRDSRVVPYIWELNVEGFDFSPLKDKQAQDAGYYVFPETDQSLIEHFLCDPVPLLSFDLHTLRENELPLEMSLASAVVKAGRMDGYAVYFKAIVDEDLVLSTSPIDSGRAPHWGYRVLRTEQIDLKAGDILDMTIGAEHWYDLDTWHWGQSAYSADEYRDCMYVGEEDDETPSS
jgi:protein arginine N-methyltransferase 1|tara:strand:- start:280 stop:1413 length:1134 start_codon:yes stop_codon:yes gene_type:complete